MEVIILIIILYLFYKYYEYQQLHVKKQRRAPFKNRYDLNRHQPISEFESKMVQGMFEEGKEVFVTAFCTEIDILSVTATIGSKFRCRPSDNYNAWGNKAQMLGATQIRQYHNHPAVFGRSFLSEEDQLSSAVYEDITKEYGIIFRSFLVYPRRLGGYAIKEF